MATSKPAGSTGEQPGPTIPVQALFEAHLTVADLDRAIRFYRDIVGLRLAHVAPERPAAFFWVGPPGGAMLGLWPVGSGPQTMRLHTAFRTSVANVLDAPRVLRSKGITPVDSDGVPTDEPVVFAWMPAASVFFRDCDGNLLEFIAMLPDGARPERGVVPWRTWQKITRDARPHRESS
jgi:lactoylglutathione lyase